MKDLEYNRTVKRVLIEALLNEGVTFYLKCFLHPELKVGSRGLLPEEVERGLILVFGPHSYEDLIISPLGISCKLQFETWETLFIPYESVQEVYDKKGNFKIEMLFMKMEQKVGNRNPDDNPEEFGL